MLLGSSPNRRLTKDERQSPAMAEAAASAPSLPWETDEDCGAGREKNSCGEATPSLGTTEQRMAVAQHNPPSIGRAKRVPNSRANRTGAPLAALMRIRLWKITRAWPNSILPPAEQPRSCSQSTLSSWIEDQSRHQFIGSMKPIWRSQLDRRHRCPLPQCCQNSSNAYTRPSRVGRRRCRRLWAVDGDRKRGTPTR